MTTLRQITSNLRLQGRFGITVALLLFVALFRPSWGEQQIEVGARAGNIVAALDVSTSMLATDAAPTRLESAKRKLRDLARLAAERPGTRLGIVLFGGAAFRYCPLTSDLKVLETYIQAVSPGLVGDRGSRLNDALTEAVQALGGKPGNILLLTDGEDSSFSVSAARQALPSGVSVSALGFGTTEGSPIRIGRGQFVRDAQGEVVMTRRDDAQLASLADHAEGSYTPARLDDADVQSFLASASTSTKMQTFTQRNEYGFIALMIAVALLVVGAYQNFVIALALVIATPSLAHAQSATGAAAARHYQRGNFEAARSDFERALEEQPDNPDLLQGLGSSQFKSGDLAGAATSFEKLEQRAPSARHRFDAAYNLGNTFLQAKRYKEAIESYDRALALEPGEARATTNKSIAEALLNQEQQQQQQEQQQQKEQPQDQQTKDCEETQGDSESQDSSSTTSPQDQNGGAGNESNAKDSEQSAAPEKDSSGQGPDALPSPRPGESEPAQELTQSASERWLDSLPEAPVLLRQKNATTSSTMDQTW